MGLASVPQIYPLPDTGGFAKGQRRGKRAGTILGGYDRGLLARLHGPAGQAPLAVVAAELEQHVAGVVEDDRGHPRSQEEIVADLGP